jgi:hypothetical protein|tara:strand:- start:229 stop:1053 length:825 start_codon:yes stop_codon:yes gene_type:complete
MFNVMKTSDIQKNGPTKVLLYAHHGFGKTYQCRFYQKRYGKGLILSGEAGLKSIEDVDIDYLPFSSWDGRIVKDSADRLAIREADPSKGDYSFRSIMQMMQSEEFKKQGYNWVAVDSLTELSERLLEWLEYKHQDNKNGFEKWGDYGRLMLGSLKWIRDLPIHVLVTCLAMEEQDANDVTQYWPLVKGKSVAKHIPALFDHVLCGVRITEKDQKGMPKVRRYVATDEVSGWHGKVRDPLNRLKPYEEVSDITELLARMSMDDAEFGKANKKEEE